MRTITPELEALLRARFQAAGSGYAARFEVDAVFATPTSCVSVGSVVNTGGTWSLWWPLSGPGINDGIVADGQTFTNFDTAIGSLGTNGTGVPYSGAPFWWGYTWDRGASPAIDAVAKLAMAVQWTCHQTGLGPTLWASDDGVTFTEIVDRDTWDASLDGTSHFTLVIPFAYRSSRYFRVRLDDQFGAGSCYGGFYNGPTVGAMQVVECLDPDPDAIVTSAYQPKRINLNKNLRMGPDQAEVELANETLALGYGPTSIFPTNSRCRVYQWFGDPANAVLTFTGVIDKVADNRDPLTTALTCRSLAGAILVDQTFSTTAPQETGETGAVRTEANGVYLNREVDYIALDIITGAGWPAADIDVADTSFVLDEFIRADGETGWDTLARLTAFVGYALWDDEDGVIHFRPLADQPGVGEPLDPDYTYEIGAGL